MIELTGKYGKAKIFTELVEDAAINQVKELLEEPFTEGQTIRMMPDIHAGKGCVVGTTMTVTDKVVPNLVGVDIGCLDMDTEYLTTSGWKKMNNYSVGDRILQYNKENDTANFVKPISYIVKKCDEFIHFLNKKGLDQMVSPEHKMLVWQGYKSRKYNLHDYSAEELSKFGNSLDKGYYGIKTSFNIDNGQGIDMTDDEIRLDVMISADGCIKYQREATHQIYIHLRKERKIERAKAILEKNGIEYKETLGVDGSTHIYFFVDKKFDKSLSRYWSASKRQLEVLASESLLWDGHKGYRSHFSSTDKNVADIVQFAFTATNIRAGLSVLDTGRKKWKPSHIVIPTKNNIIGVTNTISRVKSKDGKKYCFTVPSGYFIARRNGKVFITGNCGIYVGKLNVKDIDFKKLDDVIRKHIPAGFEVREVPLVPDLPILSQLFCRNNIRRQKVVNSLGTLGGGNHFIEVAKDEDGYLYLLIHTGSRSLGLSVAKHYQEIAEKEVGGRRKEKQELIEKLKKEGRESEIPSAIKSFKSSISNFNKDLAYLSGESLKHYLHDVGVAQVYAWENRKHIARVIVEKMGWGIEEEFQTIHNYIDLDSNILRKGAVSAKKGEKLVIPINMRDGSLICVGKGNKDWNESAPHGAGRIVPRSKARELLSMEEYQNTMKGIYTTSVTSETLDEAPMAYKPIESILENIKDTVSVLVQIKPVYNFKASEERKF